MFHLKLLTKETHPTAQDIKNEMTTHPNRVFTTKLHDYNFPAPQVKKLIQERCGVCIKKSDGFSRRNIHEFIQLGNKSVVLLAKDFSQLEFGKHLENGATGIVSMKDGLDVLQIKRMIAKGKENTFVVGGNLLKMHIEGFLKLGGSVLLKNGDLNAFEITNLLPFGKERIFIHASFFSRMRVDIFLEGKANLTFTKRTLLTQPEIEERVKKYKSQIRIDGKHYKFDKPWVKKMETLGAIII